MQKNLVMSKKSSTFAPAFRKTSTPHGAIAQLVEQRTENPCVTGSIPVGTTVKRLTRASFFVPKIKLILLFYIKVLRIQKKCSIFAANFNIVKP